MGVRSPWVGRFFLWRFYWQISTNLDESYIGRESSGGRTSTLALKYFATVKKFKIQMLYKMYKLDFKMFDYDIQPYLGVGRDWIKKYILCLDILSISMREIRLLLLHRGSAYRVSHIGESKLNSFVSWEGSSWISVLHSKVWYV